MADHANHCVRKLREMRAEEVKQKLSKFLQAIKLRSVRAMFYKWRSSMDSRVPSEPVDIVMAIAMGTHTRLGKKSQLRPFQADAVKNMIAHIAKVLGWRVVRTRKQVQEREGADGVVDAGDVLERVKEAKEIFDQFDKDGGGSIDASEVCYLYTHSYTCMHAFIHTHICATATGRSDQGLCGGGSDACCRRVSCI